MQEHIPRSDAVADGRARLIEVPVDVDEAVLRAAIQAATRASRVTVHGLTVSAPRGGPGKKADATAVESEVETGMTTDEEGKEEQPPRKKSKNMKKKRLSNELVRKRPAASVGVEIKIGCSKCVQKGCFLCMRKAHLAANEKR